MKDKLYKLGRVLKLLLFGNVAQNVESMIESYVKEHYFDPFKN